MQLDSLGGLQRLGWSEHPTMHFARLASFNAVTCQLLAGRHMLEGSYMHKTRRFCCFLDAGLCW